MIIACEIKKESVLQSRDFLENNKALIASLLGMETDTNILYATLVNFLFYARGTIFTDKEVILFNSDKKFTKLKKREDFPYFQIDVAQISIGTRFVYSFKKLCFDCYVGNKKVLSINFNADKISEEKSVLDKDIFKSDETFFYGKEIFKALTALITNIILESKISNYNDFLEKAKIEKDNMLKNFDITNKPSRIGDSLSYYIIYALMKNEYTENNINQFIASLDQCYIDLNSSLIQKTKAQIDDKIEETFKLSEHFFPLKLFLDYRQVIVDSLKESFPGKVKARKWDKELLVKLESEAQEVEEMTRLSVLSPNILKLPEAIGTLAATLKAGVTKDDIKRALHKKVICDLKEKNDIDEPL